MAPLLPANGYLAITHLTSATLSFPLFPLLLGVTSAFLPSLDLGLQHSCKCLLGKRLPHNLLWGAKPSGSELQLRRGLWGCPAVRGAGDQPGHRAPTPALSPGPRGLSLPGGTGILLWCHRHRDSPPGPVSARVPWGFSSGHRVCPCQGGTGILLGVPGTGDGWWKEGVWCSTGCFQNIHPATLGASSLEPLP